MIITEDYIAGFFDADGHFSGRSIVITNNDRFILEAIQHKLSLLDIKSTLRKHEVYRLYIFGYDNVKKFRNLIKPRLKYKREKLDKLEKIFVNKGREKELIKLAKNVKTLKENGYSFREIGRKLRIPYSYAWKIYRGKAIKYAKINEVKN